jgi:hypothetical protein
LKYRQCCSHYRSRGTYSKGSVLSSLTQPAECVAFVHLQRSKPQDAYAYADYDLFSLHNVKSCGEFISLSDVLITDSRILGTCQPRQETTEGCNIHKYMLRLYMHKLPSHNPPYTLDGPQCPWSTNDYAGRNAKDHICEDDSCLNYSEDNPHEHYEQNYAFIKHFAHDGTHIHSSCGTTNLLTKPRPPGRPHSPPKHRPLPPFRCPVLRGALCPCIISVEVPRMAKHGQDVPNA